MIGAFFVKIDGTTGKIEGKDAYHLLKVLRFKVGDIFDFIDQNGSKGKALVTSILGYSSLSFRVLEKEDYNPEFPFSLTLAQSIVKGKSMTYLLRGVTELGVRHIIPIISERTVVREVNIKRWKSIVEEAAKQSFRLIVPDISLPVDLDSFLEKTNEYDLKLIFSPYSKLHVRTFLEDMSIPGNLLCLIGPEGGFTEDEIKKAEDVGFISLSLGKRILRAEIAPLAIFSILEYRWGQH